VVTQGAQQRRFTRSRAAGDEQMAFVVASKIDGSNEFRRRRYAFRPDDGRNLRCVLELRKLAAPPE
jgi:hypothetical protein